ncbi:MFS transporter [Acinetobacter sp. CS-2]|uniref:MFS transporter n=1 Tax=Acinetobacter sp. CS-2 TaxID=2798861 RepID=UPI0019062030|nr:MFS transporter [Acinetobacter sp. CS-2]QQN39551.1 MFS transporter [Acinetobacter sp. CS-2]
MSSVESNLVSTPLSMKFMSSFILLSVLAGLGMGVFRVLTSLYGVELNASGLQLGLISAAQSIGILLMALPIGVLVKRLGSLKVFTIGSLVGASLFMVGSLFHNAWALVLITALVSANAFCFDQHCFLNASASFRGIQSRVVSWVTYDGLFLDCTITGGVFYLNCGLPKIILVCGGTFFDCTDAGTDLLRA